MPPRSSRVSKRYSRSLDREPQGLCCKSDLLRLCARCGPRTKSYRHVDGQDASMQATETILAVDDTPANLSLIAELLRDRYRVRVATNGAKALELAQASPPDLILL